VQQNSVSRQRERLTCVDKTTSLGAIAKAEGVTTTHVTNIINRAFLAPDIMRMILNGTQPASLTSDSLKRALPLPLDWENQRKLLGIKST